MSKFIKFENILVYKKKFVKDYINILYLDYIQNNINLLNYIENNKNNIDPILFKNYNIYSDKYQEELNKSPYLKYCLYKNVSITNMINVGDNIYKSFPEK